MNPTSSPRWTSIALLILSTKTSFLSSKSAISQHGFSFQSSTFPGFIFFSIPILSQSMPEPLSMIYGIRLYVACTMSTIIAIERCVGEYFKDDKTKLGNEEDPSKRMQGCKCALNSKATEEVMANIARWEPAHGRFNFRHP
ncbi:aluminum-activated malate transporter 10 [Quercus suber]|uniref:Aluminum-activated malate transporter 10 n=1 Tax=Quercus suber TaxID=58331 RepID=A0AAW0K568_QUESU